MKSRHFKLTIFGLTLIVGCSFMGHLVNGEIHTTSDSFKGIFKSGSTIIPHPAKAHKGGEDALIVKDMLISVADGVGGWAQHGVDSGKYSKQLERNIGIVHEENPGWTPKQILSEANKRSNETGTSTWVIAILHPENKTIATTLLGDSSYLLLRPHNKTHVEKLFRSEEQQKSFNFPYQCGTGGDDPKVAIDTEHRIQHNDIVVMGSDGVYDNWFDEEIIEIVQKRISDSGDLPDPQETSEVIAKLAERHGTDKTWRSPFQIGAEKAYHRRVFAGGKQDDIACIVSQIKLE